jgi:cytochrome c-type biogenesis protein CcmE
MFIEKIQLGHPISDRIQLGGSTVVPGSILWDKYKSKARFNITDGENTLSVRYVGNALLPDTFKEEALVVLEGKYNNQKTSFEADLVFAKCPSKYEGQDYSNHVEAMQETSY